MGLSCVALAAVSLTLGADGAETMFDKIGVTIAFGALPFIAIACSCFIKIFVVFALLRAALGSPSVLPAPVLAILAFVFSLFVMAPVIEEVLLALETAVPSAVDRDRFGVGQARALIEAASPPLLEFLRLNTPSGEIDFFADLAGDLAVEPGFRVLLPAFVTAEITEALTIGLLIYIPFLVVDLIVANALLALGMQMLSPLIISLPLKLALFIAVGGWHILLSGLLINYGV